ncbi:MAG TPA: AgmX/PglI C-terminal domain-containing protein [Kofleriaceae bacterium]|jgi:hypothetical protein
MRNMPLLGAVGCVLALGGNAAADAASDTARPSDESTLTLDIVLAKIQTAYMAGIRRCYKTQLERDPKLEGKVTLSLDVNKTGRVASGTATGINDELDTCIGGLMTSWRFPVPRGPKGHPVEASFVIALKLVPGP